MNDAPPLARTRIAARPGDKDGAGRRRAATACGADEEGEADGAAVGEDKPARAAIAAAREPQRRAGERIGGEKRERSVEPGLQPCRVVKPGEKPRKDNVGRGGPGRVNRCEQAAGRAVGGVPRRIGGGDRVADAAAAGAIGTGEMVVARAGGGHAKGAGAGGGAPAPARNQSWAISAMVTAISKIDGPEVMLSPISDPNSPTAVSSNGSAAMSTSGSSIFLSCPDGGATCRHGQG